jgi:hypothetical protein
MRHVTVVTLNETNVKKILLVKGQHPPIEGRVTRIIAPPVSAATGAQTVVSAFRTA